MVLLLRVVVSFSFSFAAFSASFHEDAYQWYSTKRCTIRVLTCFVSSLSAAKESLGTDDSSSFRASEKATFAFFDLFKLCIARLVVYFCFDDYSFLLYI